MTGLRHVACKILQKVSKDKRLSDCLSLDLTVAQE